MGETAATSLSPDAVPAPGRFAGRLAHFVFAPIRFAHRNPWRAGFILLGILLVLAAATLAAAVSIFQYHLRAARSELERGHNAASLRHLTWCRSIRPKERETLILSARLARRFGSWEEADGFLTEYWQEYGDEEPLVFERLLHRAARGDLEGAGPVLNARIAEGHPNARLAREALVAGLTYRFRLLEARSTINEWLKAAPDDPLALLLSGKLFEQQMGEEEAIHVYRRVVQIDPEQNDARLRLASLLVGRRHGAEAEAELIPLRAALPDNTEVQVLWARTLALLGRGAESRSALDACLRAHPDYPPALLERGTNALVDGDEAAAENDLARAARLDPGNTQVRNQYALALARNGKQVEAGQQYAAVKQLQEDGERIMALISGPLQSRPNDPSIHHEIALIALRSGLVSEAIRWFNSALQVNPDHLPTHRSLSVLYQQLDNPVLAARHRAIAQQLSTQQAKP